MLGEFVVQVGERWTNEEVGLEKQWQLKRRFQGVGLSTEETMSDEKSYELLLVGVDVDVVRRVLEVRCVTDSLARRGTERSHFAASDR